MGRQLRCILWFAVAPVRLRSRGLLGCRPLRSPADQQVHRIQSRRPPGKTKLGGPCPARSSVCSVPLEILSAAAGRVAGYADGLELGYKRRRPDCGGGGRRAGRAGSLLPRVAGAGRHRRLSPCRRDSIHAHKLRSMNRRSPLGRRTDGARPRVAMRASCPLVTANISAALLLVRSVCVVVIAVILCIEKAGNSVLTPRPLMSGNVW